MNFEYKDEKYVAAEEIIRLAEDIKSRDYTDLPKLENLIEKYNEFVAKVNSPTVAERIDDYDENVDVSTDGFFSEVSEKGLKKIERIKYTCRKYVNSNTPIPPQIKQIEGWNKTNVVAVVAIIIAAIIAFFVFYSQHTYEEGVSSGKSEISHSYDAEKIKLTDEIDLLKSQYKLATDSLKKVIDSVTETLNEFEKKRQIDVDSIQKLNKCISLKKCR